MDYLWLKVENIVAKGKIARFWAISSFVTMFSKSCLLQRRQKASIWGKGLITCIRYYFQWNYHKFWKFPVQKVETASMYGVLCLNWWLYLPASPMGLLNNFHSGIYVQFQLQHFITYNTITCINIGKYETAMYRFYNNGESLHSVK